MTDKNKKRMTNVMRIVALIMAVIMIMGIILQGFM